MLLPISAQAASKAPRFSYPEYCQSQREEQRGSWGERCVYFDVALNGCRQGSFQNHQSCFSTSLGSFYP